MYIQSMALASILRGLLDGWGKYPLQAIGAILNHPRLTVGRLRGEGDPPDGVARDVITM
jgi:hypothetical protein